MLKDVMILQRQIQPQTRFITQINASNIPRSKQPDVTAENYKDSKRTRVTAPIRLRQDISDKLPFRRGAAERESSASINNAVLFSRSARLIEVDSANKSFDLRFKTRPAEVQQNLNKYQPLSH